MSSSIPADSTVPSNTVVFVSSMLLTTVKSAATVDSELSRVTVTTAPPVSAQSTDADAVGAKTSLESSGSSPSHASLLSTPPVGVKESFPPLTSISAAHSSPHSIGMANFFVAPALIFTARGRLPSMTTRLPLTLTATSKVAAEPPSLVISSGNVEPVAVGLSSTQSGGHTFTDPRLGGFTNGHPPPSFLVVFSVSPRVPRVNEPSASPSESSQVNWVRNAFFAGLSPLLEKNTTVGSLLSTPPGLKLNAAP